MVIEEDISRLQLAKVTGTVLEFQPLNLTIRDGLLQRDCGKRYEKDKERCP